MNERTEVGRSVARAEMASGAWQRLGPKARAKHIRRIRERVAARQHHLVDVISAETERPMTDVLIQEITASLGMLHFMEGHYPRWLNGRRFRDAKPGFWTKSNRLVFDPIGTVAVIGPSNFPFSLVVMQTCAALLCGNTVVLKPSEKCPRVSAELRRLFGEVDLPDGVVTLVEGGPEVVEEIIAQESVSKVFFTGSTGAGRAVSRLCGAHFKPCVLELGGDGPAIVCADADVKLAARGITWSALYAGGTACIGTRCVFVEESISSSLVVHVQMELSLLRMGSSDQKDCDITHGHDLRIVFPDRPDDLSSASRNRLESIQPDTLNDPPGFEANSGTTLEWIVIGSAEEAVRRINDASSGLSASIWSASLGRARQIAAELRVGMVWINDASVAQPNFSWGGVRGSGWGRLFSREAISEMTHTKTISVDHRRTARPKIWWFPYSSAKYDLTAAANSFLFGGKRWASVGSLLRSLLAYWRR